MTAEDFACGPVPGSNLVEIQMIDAEKQTFALLIEYEGCYRHLCISDHSFFETAMNQEAEDEENYDNYVEEMDEKSFEVWDWDRNETDYEMLKSENIRLIQLCCLAMDIYDNYPLGDEGEEALSEFNAKYKGKKLEEIILPAFSAPWDENDEYENENFRADYLEAFDSDPIGWVCEYMVECRVEKKKTGEIVYVVGSSPEGEFYSIYVSKESRIHIENDKERHAIPKLEEYQNSSEAVNSEYYEVIRRVLHSIEAAYLIIGRWRDAYLIRCQRKKKVWIL